MLFNCFLACFIYNVPIDHNSDSWDLTGNNPECFRVDNHSGIKLLEIDLGTKTNTYRIYKGSVIESYAYGSSAICRSDTKHEMDIWLVAMGGESDAHIRACKE